MEGARLSRWISWSRVAQAGLSLGLFLLVWLSPLDRYVLSDPRWALLVSQSLLEQGTVELTPYASDLQPLLDAQPVWHQIYRSDEGRWLYAYPVGNSILALPFVGVANLLGWDMRIPADEIALQRLLGALVVAGGFLLMVRLARVWLPPGWAIGWSLALTTGTTMLASAGLALFGHSGLILAVTLALWLSLSPAWRDDRRAAVAVGVALFFAFACRPQAAVFIASFYLYLLLYRRRILPWVVAGSLPLLLLFLGLVWPLYHDIPGTYYYQGAYFGLSLETLKTFIYGHGFSPSRGLFVYSPFLLVILMLGIAYRRTLWREKALLIPLVWLPAHTAMVSLWSHWEGGWSFGPRLLVDTIPGWCLLGAAALAALHAEPRRVARRLWLALLALTWLPAGIIQIRQGLYNEHTIWWHDSDHLYPPSAGYYDWRYPQFLATARRNDLRVLDHLPQDAIAPLTAGERFFVDRPGVVLGEGWSGIERNDHGPFVWGGQGTLRLYLLPALWRPAVGTGNAELTLELGCFIPLEAEIQVAGAEPVTYANPETSLREVTLHLPASALASAERLEIVIQAPMAARPADLFDSTDMRLLSVRLHALRLIPAK